MRIGVVLLAAGALLFSCSEDGSTGSGAGGSAGAAGSGAAAGAGALAGAGGAAGGGGAAGAGGAAGGSGAGADGGAVDAAVDAPVSDGAGFDGNSACNYLVQLGLAISAVTSGGGAPSPKGGTITDGFYELVGVNLYGGAKGTTFQRSLRFVGNELKTVERDGTAAVDFTTTGTYAVAGTTLTRAITCPAPAGQVWGYTAPASGTSFIAYETQGVNAVVELFYQWNSP